MTTQSLQVPRNNDEQGVATGDAVLVLRHVTLRYDSGTQALDDVSLSVRRGEHLCVLGANGSGKSTLASVLCGLLAPDQGQVRLVGRDVFDADRPEPIDFVAYKQARRNLSLVFQNPDDQIVTTIVEEDVAFGPENLGVDPEEIGRRVERELHRVAMTAYAKADPTRLSGGQKQRVAIAGALAMRPQVLVFDEPGALLDVRGRGSIMRVMGKLCSEGTTVVHITHFMEEALEADRVIVLDRGRIVLEGTPNEVFTQREQIMGIGLEEPFCARLATGLRSRGVMVPWTCNDGELFMSLTGTPDSPTLLFATDAEHTQTAAPHEAKPGEPVLVADRVSFSYDGSYQALDEVSFVIERGSSVAIVGQTGSGKSTLLRLLCALEAPDSGRVLVRGIDTARKHDRRRLHGTIGFVMQHPERQLFAETVLQDVSFGPKNMGLSAAEVEKRSRDALALVGLVGLEGASPFELSGGQQRLCAIAGILAMEPSIIVLDEPTAGLDPHGRRELYHVISGIHKQGVTVVQVTHSMEDAARTEKLIVLDQARVMRMGAPREVFCKAYRNELTSHGLGLPLPLTWSYMLEEAGYPSLGEPLTLNELANAIAALDPKIHPVKEASAHGLQA